MAKPKTLSSLTLFSPATFQNISVAAILIFFYYFSKSTNQLFLIYCDVKVYWRKKWKPQLDRFCPPARLVTRGQGALHHTHHGYLSSKAWLAKVVVSSIFLLLHIHYRTMYIILYYYTPWLKIWLWRGRGTP